MGYLNLGPRPPSKSIIETNEKVSYIFVVDKAVELRRDEKVQVVVSKGCKTEKPADPPAKCIIYTYIYVYIYIYLYIYTHVDNSSPGLWSAVVLNHICLGLELSNGRDRRCLRARGPQDHLHSRPPWVNYLMILKTQLYICRYIYIYVLSIVRQASGLWAC